VDLFDHCDSIAKLGQQLLVGISAMHYVAECRSLAGQAVEDRFQPFEWFLAQDALEPLLPRFTDCVY
jgi:hypothetical protein